VLRAAALLTAGAAAVTAALSAQALSFARLASAGSRLAGTGSLAERTLHGLPTRPPQSRTSLAAVEKETPLVKVSEPLNIAGQLMGLLKPIFAAQAKAQAGSYDEAAVRAEIEAEVKSAPVVLYTYGLSPFSSETKRLLDDMKADYKEIELGPEWFLLSGPAAAKRAELGNMFGRTSLPQVFIGGRSIGGLTEGTPGLAPLLASGELVPALKKAGALPDDSFFGFFLYSGDFKK